ncbi:MAG: transglutaminase domain-containing protein [Oscillospiraceae bacterium]|jgi:hypothetical protein
MQHYRYYYRQMNKAEQSVYDAMYAGFTALAPSIRVLHLSEQTLTDIYFRLKLDNPAVFYVTSFSYRYALGADFVELVPEYMFEKTKIRTHQQAIAARVAKLVRPAKSMTPEEKELYIHDFICNNVRYDKLQKPYSHEIIGPLTHGIGVCEGIAKTVKLLCDELGLECLIAISEADPEHGAKYRHAWNIITLGKHRYHLDVTFDNSLQRYGSPRYDYYNLDDKKLFRDHRPLVFPVPACSDGNGFYYLKNRLSLTKPEMVENRVKQAIRKRKPTFVFHWRGGYLTRDVLSELLQTAETTAQGLDRHIGASVNMRQSVIQLFFQQEQHNTVEEETADEAEEGLVD